jgi:hypothetical protein
MMTNQTSDYTKKPLNCTLVIGKLYFKTIIRKRKGVPLLSYWLQCTDGGHGESLWSLRWKQHLRNQEQQEGRSLDPQNCAALGCSLSKLFHEREISCPLINKLPLLGHIYIQVRHNILNDLFVLKTRSHDITQAGLELTILLPQLPECWIKSTCYHARVMWRLKVILTP